MECVLEGKKWPKSIPKISDRATAVAVAQAMVENSFFHRSEKVEEKKGYFRVSEATDEASVQHWQIFTQINACLFCFTSKLFL